MAFQLPLISRSDLEQLPSPSMVVFLDRVHSNMDSMIRMAGSVDRLRPHCKTHKMEAIVKMLIEKGIRKHKAATIAEVEMLAEAGATDVLLAYNPVGPNIARVVQLAQRFPQCRLTVTADHAAPVAQLSAAAAQANVEIGVLLDVNVGQNRTGIDPDSPAAIELYRTISKAPGLKLPGFTSTMAISEASHSTNANRPWRGNGSGFNSFGESSLRKAMQFQLWSAVELLRFPCTQR